ncbi:MAG TPA: response regulator [Vicinamibacterales bacterium]|nr:response regulator [Vicinamibacterales bacterium]
MMTTTTTVDAPAAGFNAAAWLEEHAAGDILMTPDGWLLNANRPAARMFRFPAGQDARGLNFRRFCRQPAQFAETVQAIQSAGFVGNWDGDLAAFDGRPVHAVINLVGEFDGRVLTGVRAQIFDITEWRRSQERTLFGQRIEAIGRLAGGVAHDFNNLLTVISGHAECLSLAITPDSPMNRSVSAIQASAARAATLTQKLLSFGRRQVLQPRVVDLGGLVMSVESELRRTFGHRISISSSIARPVCRVRVDPGQTERALATIATHAIDAMDDGGALAFRVSHADIGPEWSPSRAFVKPGLFTRLDVTGAGMTLDADAHVRMFEPFFREKGTTRDGMGLAAVFGLIKQSGGYLWLEGERPGETTFTVLLPAEAADTQAPSADQEPAEPSTGTILVVDDDDAVRALIVKILEHQGYSVLEAASAQTGLRLSRSRSIDLLVSDVVLDGARGDDLAATMLAARPEMRLLCISGYPAETRALREFDPTRALFLEKPFSAAQLIERVSGLLEQ